MTLNMKHLRQFCRAFQSAAETTRIMFPDEKVNVTPIGTTFREHND